MSTTQITNTLSSLTEGLRLRDAGLATLIGSASQQTTTYDFFRILAADVIPYLKKCASFQTLIKRWERKTRSSHKEINALKQVALQEVTDAFSTLSKRLKGIELLTSIQGLQKSLDETKGYLDGTLPVYIPYHFEMAADALAQACRLLLANRQVEMVSDLVEIAYFNDKREPPGIARCYFYEAISKIIKARQEWGCDCFEEPHICWSYLNLTQRCWNPTMLENEELKNDSVEDCEHSGELLGLHGYWVELQGIRNKRQQRNPFFTIERFSKYLEVICLQILAHKAEKEQSLSTSIHALELTIYGDSLLLLVETESGRKTTPYLLHTYNIESGPYFFMKSLIEQPEKDWHRSDFKIHTNSPTQMLNRANIKGILKTLFVKKSDSGPGRIQLTRPKVLLEDFDFNTQLAIQKQIADLKLEVYNRSGITLRKEWTTR